MQREMTHEPVYDPTKVFMPEFIELKKFKSAKLSNDHNWYVGTHNKIGPLTKGKAAKKDQAIKMYGRKKKTNMGNNHEQTKIKETISIDQ